MKNITIVATVFAILFSASLTARAAATPWAGNIGPTNPITIPAGKILIIKSVTSGFTTPQAISFQVSGTAAGGIGSGPFTNYFTIMVGALNSASNAPINLQLGPGMTLTCSVGTHAVFGVAMDTGDYIASTSSQIRDLSSDGTQLAAIVDSRTSAPTKTTGEVSTNLTTWATLDTTVVQSSINPRITKITTPANAPAKFVRVKTTKSQ